jgi:hypothetical protein
MYAVKVELRNGGLLCLTDYTDYGRMHPVACVTINK